MSDLMREDFEAAIISEFKSVGCIDGPDLSRSENNGDYLNQVAGGAWWAWQASRECLVIELPAWEEYSGTDEGAAQAILDCERSINAAGVKTK